LASTPKRLERADTASLEEAEILKSLGAPLGEKRPDIVIEDHEQQRVVSVIEVKYYPGVDAWKRALRDGVGQLYRERAK